MDFSLYLAMAPRGALPKELGYARFFCPFGKEEPPVEGLPEGYLPIFTDSTPYAGQKPEDIANHWGPLVQGAPGLVLDFQRKCQPGLWDFVQALRRLLPCPAAAVPAYAGEKGPVFLPPIPPDTLPEDALAPWQGREIWLDLGTASRRLTLTPTGCRGEDLPAGEAAGFADEALCCHYRVTKAGTDKYQFLLWRSEGDLLHLMEKGSRLGVRRYVGLYPELTGCGFVNAQRLPGSGR